jgi:hypothetical protein
MEKLKALRASAQSLDLKFELQGIPVLRGAQRG